MVNFKKYFAGPKIIFAILGLILLVEVIYATKVLTTPAPTPPPVVRKSIPLKTAGRISLVSPRTNYKVKDSIAVSVMVNTGGQTINGADLIVHFDPKFLEATTGGLIKGRILDEYPLVSLDAKKGLISISGISSLKKGYRGSGLFATLNFKAKAIGNTSLMIDFTKGATTDSNLVESSASKDILESIDNLQLNVK